MSSKDEGLILNNKVITFVKNFSYTFSSNILTMIVSALVILIVPKLIGVQEYGYWQLYMFYSFYVGFLHFGWNDGIYLRYGGQDYKDLNKKIFFSQFWMQFFFQTTIFIGLLLYCQFYVGNSHKLFILEMTGVCAIISNTRIMLLYILQGTNRIKEYAKCTISDRLLYIALVIFLLLIGVRDYKLLIYADLIGKSCSLLYAIYFCNDIVIRKLSDLSFNVKETMANINIGIKLMLANIASVLIIGIVRYGIERTWDVSTFGRISLTLSVSNLMMIFISALGIIMFPMLRRMDEDKFPELYINMRTFLMVPLIGVLIFYYPLRIILTLWLPEYRESLMYMALVFPMCIYDGKMSLLINTYLKALRKEKIILFVNAVSVMISCIVTALFTVIYENLTLSVISIVIVLSFRCIFAEILLAKILEIKVFKDIILELVMTFIFIMTGWLASTWTGVSIYLLFYGLYLLIKRKDAIASFNKVKRLIKI
ncbi:hypothetical protein MKY54_24895 [Paenibacillus sp. FSL P2-0121]|uniref:lipopolysaccharide biosynthesis protein n=1 Tax=Paenibacillus sp. FSL P2-0121 TaxID=2921626 RepID=UPI0030CF28C0